MMDKHPPPPQSPIAGGHSQNKPGLAQGQWGWMALSWEHTCVSTHPRASTLVTQMDVLARMCIPLQAHVHTHASVSIHDHAHMRTHMIVQTHLRSGTRMHTHTHVFTCTDTHILTHMAQQPSMATAPAVSSPGGDTGGQSSPQTPRPHTMCCASVSPLGTICLPHCPGTCGPWCATG